MVATDADVSTPTPVVHGLRVKVKKRNARHVARAPNAEVVARFPVGNAHDSGELEQFRRHAESGEDCQIERS